MSKRLYWWEELEEAAAGKVAGGANRKGARKNSQRPPQVLIPNCSHWRQRFELKDGLHVYASAWMDRPDQYRLPTEQAFSGEPDIGFYLDPRWVSDQLMVSPGFGAPLGRTGKRTNKVVAFPWPDYGVPRDKKLLLRCLGWLLGQVEEGKIVEIACMGGHGRTGSLLACLLVSQGMTPEGAIRRVWRRYCPEAIESRQQIAFLKDLA